MNELIDFLIEITENSLKDIERDEWTQLRNLSQSEVQQLWDIDEAFAEFSVLKAEVECALTPDRRGAVESRHDLTDTELELLGRLMLARDVLQATQNAFWSPLKYEFRNFEQLMLDTDKVSVMGRGNNRERRLVRVLEPVGSPNEDEIRRPERLFQD